MLIIIGFLFYNILMSERIAHLHIEKTAGTSIRKGLFEPVYGKQNVLLYHPPIDMFRRISDLRSERYTKAYQIKELLVKTPLRPIVDFLVLQLRKRSSTNDIAWEALQSTDYKVVSGHFSADKINFLLDHFTTVVIRNPLERMYSHYLHWNRKNGATQFRINIEYNPDVTFEEFAMLEKLKDYQTQALRGKPLEEFDLVGTTTNLNSYSYRLLSQLGLDPYSYPLDYHNRTINKPPLEVSQDFANEFREFHINDYTLYEHALSLENNLQIESLPRLI